MWPFMFYQNPQPFQLKENFEKQEFPLATYLLTAIFARETFYYYKAEDYSKAAISGATAIASLTLSSRSDPVSRSIAIGVDLIGLSLLYQKC